MTVNAFIQARVSSSRLPGKVLKSLAGKPVLKHVIDRVSQADFVDKVVVVTSTDVSDDAIEAFCRDIDCAYFRGELDDVLSRFNAALSEFPCDHILRVTADCPLIDPHILDVVLIGHLAGQYDYYGLGGEFPNGLAQWHQGLVLTYSQFFRKPSQRQRHNRQHPPVYEPVRV